MTKTDDHICTDCLHKCKSFKFKIKSCSKKFTAKKSELKYHNKICYRDGFRFASIKERKRYDILKILEKNAEIFDLQLQPVFILQEEYTDKNKKKHREIKYIADFKYFVNGMEIVEDVKSKPTAKKQSFRDKIKMLKKVYPDINFYIVMDVDLIKKGDFMKKYCKSREEIKARKIIDELFPDDETKTDTEFLVSCNLHPHSENSLKILTENDEGAYLSTDKIKKLIEVLVRYIK